MGIEENKALVRHICTLFTKGELETAFSLFSTGYTEHSGLREIRKKKFMQSTTLFFDSFRDVQINIEEIVAEGDRVAVRETWTAVHTGREFMGIAPTGKNIKFTNTCIFRIADGKIAECWATLDSLNTLQQLGVLPPTEEIGK